MIYTPRNHLIIIIDASELYSTLMIHVNLGNSPKVAQVLKELSCTSMVHVGGEFKLRTWRLEESWEWQLVSDISPLFASINLYKRHFRVHNNLERTTDGRTLHFGGEWDPDKDEDGLHILFTLRFVLPRWLHPIPSSPS
ncbi:hypothetical protein F2Q70_00005583 [Brassica cretica]|uniref:Uncharacterized protein n=1 Tax=Brassica cretica TaxID=69181 RepID=A0A8S9IVS3_BRACR|nr:hypothetical protein F2Q70_00005583 [Brassica cretica]